MHIYLTRYIFSILNIYLYAARVRERGHVRGTGVFLMWYGSHVPSS